MPGMMDTILNLGMNDEVVEIVLRHRPASKKTCSSNFYLKRTSNLTCRARQSTTRPRCTPVLCADWHISVRTPSPK